MSNRPQQAMPQFKPDILRRNLFRAQPPRRPTSSSTATTATTLHESPDANDNADEILVRDNNGNYAPTFPTLPELDTENAPEEENKVDDAKIEDMLKNRPHQQSEQELFEAVRASLRRTVDSLNDDNWMFEHQSGTIR